MEEKEQKPVTYEDLSQAYDSLSSETETHETDKADTSNENGNEKGDENIQDTSSDETPETKSQTETSETESDDDLPDEPEDNAVRSKLGKRVSRLEQAIEMFIEEMRIDRQNNIENKNDRTDTNPEEMNEDLEEYISKKDLPAYLQKFEDEKEKKITQFNTDYSRTFIELGKGSDPEFHNKVMEELKANFNIKRSNDGIRDATENYLKAKIAILEKSAKKPANPLDKNKDKETKNLGGPSDTITEVQSKKIVKLDPDSQHFVNYIRSQPGGDKWTDEKVSEIMTREPSLKNIKHA